MKSGASVDKTETPPNFRYCGQEEDPPEKMNQTTVGWRVRKS
jgi:hypothetical protein